MFRFTFFLGNWFYFLLLIHGITPSFSQMECAENALEKCTNILQTVIQNPDLAFAQNEAELAVSCRYFDQYMDCIKNLANTCFKEPLTRQAFLGTFSGFMSVLPEMCTPGSPFRREYLKHASCYRGTEKELQYCIDKYTSDVEAVKTEEIPGDEKLKKYCCYMNTTTDCVLAPTLEKCGNEAADLFRQASEKIFGPLVGMCSSLNYDRSLCAGASSMIISSFLLFILTIIPSLGL